MVGFIMMFGCKNIEKSRGQKAGDDSTEVENPTPECENTVAGTLVDKTGLDGCSMVIQVGDNEFLEPINLNELNIDIREGVQIEFSYDEVDAATICMMGQAVRITCVEEKRG